MHNDVAMDNLAVAAFVLSVIALIWNVGLAVVRWPRIAVDINRDTMIGKTIDVGYRVLASNLGAEDTTVWNVGLAVKGSAEGHMYTSVENERANGREVAGPDLPAILPARATLSWTFSSEVGRGIVPGTVSIGVVQRYQPPRWFRPNKLPWAEYRSIRSDIR